MTRPHPGRRILLSTFLLAPVTLLARSHKAIAQTAPGASPIVQPREKTKAGFLARARALRDQAVREGDQAYGAVVYVMGCRQLWAGSPIRHRTDFGAAP